MIKTFKTFASFALITCMLSLRVSCFFARAETQFGSQLSSMPGSGKLRSLSETVFGISCVCLLVLSSFFLVISLLKHTGSVVLGLVRFCARIVAGAAGFVAAVVCSVVDLLLAAVVSPFDDLLRVIITYNLPLLVRFVFAAAEIQFGPEFGSWLGSGKLQSLAGTVFGISCVCLLVLSSFFLVISLLKHTGSVVLGLVRFCARIVAGTAGFVAAVVCSVVDLLHRFVAATSCSVLDCVHSFFAPEGKEQVEASIVVPRRRFGREPRKGARIRFAPDESLVSACFIPHRSEIPQDEKIACYHSAKEIIEMAHFNYQDCHRSPAGRFSHKVKMAVLPVVCDERFLVFAARVFLHCFFPSVEQELYLKIASFVTSRSPRELTGWLILVSFLLIVAVCCLKMLVNFVPYLLLRTGVAVHEMARIWACFAERGCACVRSLNASHVVAIEGGWAKDPTGDLDGEEEEDEEEEEEEDQEARRYIPPCQEEEESELEMLLSVPSPIRKRKVQAFGPCNRTRPHLVRKCKENVRYSK